MFVHCRESPRQNPSPYFKRSNLEDDNPISCDNDIALESACSYDFVFGSNGWAKYEAMEDLWKIAKMFAEEEVIKKELIADLNSSFTTAKTVDFISETIEKSKELVTEVFEKIGIVDPNPVDLVPDLKYSMFSEIVLLGFDPHHADFGIVFMDSFVDKVFAKILTHFDTDNSGEFPVSKFCTYFIYPALDPIHLPWFDLEKFVSAIVVPSPEKMVERTISATPSQHSMLVFDPSGTDLFPETLITDLSSIFALGFSTCSDIFHFQKTNGIEVEVSRGKGNIRSESFGILTHWVLTFGLGYLFFFFVGPPNANDCFEKETRWDIG